MQTNILEYLESAVMRVPEKVAFSDGEAGLTFRQVSDLARSTGTWLIRQGMENEPVVVFMKKQPATLAAFLGVVYAGCYYVPLDDEMPRHRIELILNALQPRAMICDEHTRPMAEQFDYNGQCWEFDRICAGLIDAQALDLVREQQIDTDPIYIVFTSGSTGVPKGVTACHRSVIDYVEQLCDVLEFDETCVFGNQTPLYFDAYLKEVMPTLKYGATTILIPRQLFLFPVKLVEFLNEHRINTICWVVSALTMISSMRTFDKIKPEYLRTVAFASEVFPIKQFNLWRHTLPQTRFFNLYGPTETTGICCYYRADREFGEEEAIPIGRPFHNTQILLLTDENQLAGPGEQGEICIRGTRLTLGYYKNPEMTQKAFVQNPLNDRYPELIYRTGDIGRYNDQGELVFVSRKDFQIKHMGHRIELGEIEAVANLLEGMNSVCCIFDQEKKKIILYFAGEPEIVALSAHLKQRLPRYMMPHLVRKLERLPLTPNGKIDRKQLMQTYQEQK